MSIKSASIGRGLCRLVPLSILLLCSGSAFGQRKDPAIPQRMTSSEYGSALDRIQAGLGTWEATLQKIDPSIGNPSYDEGKLIEQNRDVGLIAIDNIRDRIQRERSQRSVYGELALSNFLTELDSDFGTLAAMGGLNNVSMETVAQNGAEIRYLRWALWMDGMNRVRDMEKAGCGRVTANFGN